MAGSNRTVARSGGCTMCQRDHEDNKSIISGGREAERASRQRTLCNCCPGLQWPGLYPGTIPDGLSLSLFLPVSHRRRRRRYRPHGLVRRRDGSRVSTHRVYYQVLQTFKI